MRDAAAFSSGTVSDAGWWCAADDPTGKIVHVFRSDVGEMADTAPPGPMGQRSAFTASRLEPGARGPGTPGGTVVACASGNRVLVFDQDHKLIWQVTNAELFGDRTAGGFFNDVCGMQVLNSGNILVSTYGNKEEDGVKMLEISPDKEIVWEYHHPNIGWI